MARSPGERAIKKSPVRVFRDYRSALSVRMGWGTYPLVRLLLYQLCVCVVSLARRHVAKPFRTTDSMVPSRVGERAIHSVTNVLADAAMCSVKTTWRDNLSSKP